VVLAALVRLLVFGLPRSVRGSEIAWTTVEKHNG